MTDTNNAVNNATTVPEDEKQKKSYYVQLPGYAKGEVWDEDKYNRNKEALFREHPDVSVFERTTGDIGNDIADDETLTVYRPGFNKGELWDGAKFKRNREKLYKDIPDIQVSRVKAVDYNAETLAETNNAIAERQKRMEELEHDNTVVVTPTGGTMLAPSSKDTRVEKSRIEGELKDLYAQREANPAYQRELKAKEKFFEDEDARYSAEMKKLEENNPASAKYYKTAAIRAYSGGRGFASGESDPQFNRDYECLQAAKKFMDDAKETAFAPSKYDTTNGFANFFRGIYGVGSDVITLKQLYNAGLNQHLIDAVKKIQETEGTDKSLFELINDPGKLSYLSDAEKELVKAFCFKSAVDADRAGDLSLGYQSGASAYQSLGFMADFFLTGGLGSAAGKAATKGLLRATAAASAKGTLKGAARQAAKFGIGTLEAAVKTAVMSPLMPSTWVNIQNNLLQINKAETLDLTGEAIGRAIGDAFIENLSENAGPQIEAMLGGAVNLMGKGANKLFRTTKFTDWAKIFDNSGAARLLRDAAWNGYIGEIGEEWYGNALRVMTGVDPDALKNFATVDQQIITLTSFAPMSVFGGVTSAAQYGVARKNVSKSGEYLASVLRKNGYGEDQIKDILDVTKAENPTMLASHLAPVINQIANDDLSAGQEAYKAVMDYADAVAKYRVFDGIHDADVSAQRDKMHQEFRSQMGDDADIILRRSTKMDNGAEATYDTVHTLEIDGKTAYIVGENEDGTIALQFEDGEKRIYNRSAVDALLQKEDSGWKDNGEMRLDDYLDMKIAARKNAAEQNRMSSERREQEAAILSKVNPGDQINIGTEEAPIMGTVVGKNGEKVILEVEGQYRELTPDEVGNALKTPVSVKADADIEQELITREEQRKRPVQFFRGKTDVRLQVVDKNGDVIQVADAITDYANPDSDNVQVKVDLGDGVFDWQIVPAKAVNDAIDEYEKQHPATTEAAETTEGTEEGTESSAGTESAGAESADTETKPADTSVPTDFRGNPIPLKRDGTVDQTAFWNSDPEAWTKWNDEKRGDGGVNSMEYLKKASDKLKADIKATQKKLDKETDFDRIDQLEQKKATLEERLKTLSDIQNGYRMQAAEAARQKAEEEAAKAKAARDAQAAELEKYNTDSLESIKEKWEKAPKEVGSEDTFVLSSGEEISGHYVLTEAFAPTASHNTENGFAKTEGFPVDENGRTVNDRDYEHDKAAQQQVEEKAASYDQRALQTPVVVSQDGVVLSGNDRTMASQIAARQGTDTKYNEYLVKHAQKYGFTPEQVAGFKNPRVVFVPNSKMPYNAATFAKFNAEDKKTQSKTESAVKAGKVISPEAVEKIAQIIDGHESIAETYADEKAVAAIIRVLVDAGIVQKNEISKLMDGNVLSGTGEDLVESVILGAVLREDALRCAMEDKSMRRSIMTALTQLIKNNTYGEYSLADEFSAAVVLLYQAKKSGLVKIGDKVANYLDQPVLEGFGENPVASATIQMLADIINGKKVNGLKNVISLYNARAAMAATGQADLFLGDVESREQILTEIIAEYERRNNAGQQEAVSGGNEEAGSPEEQAPDAVRGDAGSGEAGRAGREGSNSKGRRGTLQPADERRGDLHEGEIAKVDNQGNPLNEDGTLKVDEIQSIEELTDADFIAPTRSIQLPKIPDVVDDAIGAVGKPVVIKKNIFERNAETHPEVTPQQAREILYSALYRTDLYGQNQKEQRPYNWIVINTKDSKGQNRLVVLEVNANKDNVEIVHWYSVDDRGVEKIKRQAKKEGGHILTLPSETEEAGALSGRQSGLSSDGKDTQTSEKTSESAEKSQPDAKNEGQFGLVSDERMAELKKRLLDKIKGQLNSGFDPELLSIGMEMAAGYIDRGIKTFVDFSKAMIADFGDAIRPYLKAFYNGAREMPGMEQLSKEMDAYDSVSAIDVNSVGKEEAKEEIKSTYEKKTWTSDSDIAEMKERRSYLDKVLAKDSAESKDVFPEEQQFRKDQNDLRNKALSMKEEEFKKEAEAFKKKYRERNERIRAIYDELSNLNDSIAFAEQKRDEKAREKEKADKKTAIQTKYNGFLRSKSPMLAAAADKALSKRYQFDDEVLSLAEFVERHFAAGDLKAEAKETQPYPSRSKWNQMTGEEQKAWMQSHKPTTLYFVNHYELGKHAYDYAKYLEEKQSENIEAQTQQKRDELFGLTPAEKISSADEISSNIEKLVSGLAEHGDKLKDTNSPYSAFGGFASEGQFERNAQKQVEEYVRSLSSVDKAITDEWKEKSGINSTDALNEYTTKLYNSANKTRKEDSNENSKKAETKQGERIDDVGEKIAGARKDLLIDYVKKLKDANLESLITMQFSKVFKRPNLNKAVETGELRPKDARFAEAVIAALLSTSKPLASKSRSRFQREKREREIKNWAQRAFSGISTLKELFEADEAQRDALIDKILNEKAYNESEIEARLVKMREWNQGMQFNGECKPLNMIAVFYKAYEQIGADTYGDRKSPIADIRPDSGYRYYTVEDASGDPISPSRQLLSEQDVIDEVVYAIKVANGDENIDHPSSAFKFSRSEPIYESDGYRVLYTVKEFSSNFKEEKFKTKEEAQEYQEKLKERGYTTYGIDEVKKHVGYGKYTLFFSSPYRESIEIPEVSFSSIEEARAAFDENRDEYNEIFNKKIAEEKPDSEKHKNEKVSVQAYWDRNAKSTRYGVYLADRYTVKTAFSNMPFAVKNGFATKKEAEAYLNEHKAEIETQIDDIEKRRREFTYFDGDAKERIGEGYRKGKDVTAEEFRTTFGFRGVQFGNWANQKDRQAAINNAYDSLMDLAKILEISPKAISLNGELGIAFGSRGTGKASAHYELDEVVINLTKTRGAGSLAHEWWHALDNYFARQGNVSMGMVTDSRQIKMRDEMREAYNRLLDNLAKSDYDSRSRQKGASYWGTRHEETARMFEIWVATELSKLGERNHFLVGEGANMEEEFAQINYANYRFFFALSGSEGSPMSFEEFMKRPEALHGFVYPTQKEMETFGKDLRNIFDTVEEKADEETGNVALFQKDDEEYDNESPEKQLAFDAVSEMLNNSGIQTETLSNEDMERLAEGDTTVLPREKSPMEQWIDNYVNVMLHLRGTDEKDSRRNLAKMIDEVRREAKELYENVLSGNFNAVTLQQINDYIDNATPRNRFYRPLSQRLPERALLSLSENDRTASVDALFSRICESTVPANGRTRAEGRRKIEARKEELLEKWAKVTGNWHESIADFTSHTEALRSGTDSDVYLSDDGTKVIKASKGKFGNRKHPSDTDQVPLFNSVFPGSAYRILGYGRLNGKFVRFLEQPFVDFSTATPLTVEERVAFMGGLGFMPLNKEKTLFTNGELVVSDLQKSNIVKGEDGNIWVIDADVKLHTKDLGGNYTYPSVETDTDTAEFMTVYHGSGVRFDRFDHSHMGEGEGNQAFGWGSYVSEVEGIGKTYASVAGGLSKSELESNIWRAEERLPHIKDKELRKQTKQQIAEWKKQLEERGKFLYSIDIPEDTGKNYLDYDKTVSAEEKERVFGALADTIIKGDEDGSYEDDSAKKLLREELKDLVDGRMTGKELYGNVSAYLGSDKAASEFLNSLGYVGIKYPANYFRGGTEKNESNYVIFNEKDLKITGRVEFLKNGSTVYGAAVGGKILLNAERLNPNTPIHEYTHLWDAACRQKNPELWKRGVELMKQTPLWKEIENDPNYAGLDEEGIAGEVHARLSGEHGAETLERMSREALDKNGGFVDKAARLSVIQKLRKWLSEFWYWVKNTMTPWSKDEADKVSIEDFVNMPLADLAKGTRLSESQLNAEERDIVEKAKADGTYMKAPNGKPSNLNERQWVQVRTKAFKAWFGDWENDPKNASKVVDENGEPRVVYHGTDSEFTVFDPEKGDYLPSWEPASKWTDRHRCFYFTGLRKMAESYKGARELKEVFLNIRDAYEFDGKGRAWNDLRPFDYQPYEGEDIVKLAKATYENLLGQSKADTAQQKLRGEEPGDKSDAQLYFRNSVLVKLYEEYRKIENIKPKNALEKVIRSLRLAIAVRNMEKHKDSYKEFAKAADFPFRESAMTFRTRELDLIFNDKDGIIIKSVYDYGNKVENPEPGDVFVVYDSNNVKSATDNSGEFSVEDNDIRFHIVTDKKEIDRLNSEPTMKAYRGMQLVDGKLYPPMSAKVNGEWREGIDVKDLGKVWEQADENPELADDKGNFKLDKGNKSSLKARYNPYIHTSTTPLNDQFSSAQSRPELVTVEVEIPKSELTSGYKAEKAKDSVGKVEWKAGVIQSQLTGTRTVILSRWDKPMRIVPDSEVADVIVKMFGDKKITMPSNVVTPSLRAELEKRGIPFVETDNTGKPVTRFRDDADGTYDKAVADGDMETAQKIVDAEAEKKMKKSVVRDEDGTLKKVYHGSRASGFTVFDKEKTDDGRSLFFTDNEAIAKGYAETEGEEGSEYSVYLDVRKPLVVEGNGEMWNSLNIGGIRWALEGTEDPTYKKILNRINRQGATFGYINEENDIQYKFDYDFGREALYGLFSNEEMEKIEDKVNPMGIFDYLVPRLDKKGKCDIYTNTRTISELAENAGYDGVIFNNIIDAASEETTETVSNVYAVFDPSAVKSADAVTRDNNGNIIPPSERFNRENEDIRFREDEIASMETPILESKGTFKNLKEAEQWAKKNLQGKSYTNRFTNSEVHIGSRAISEMLNPKSTKAINERTHIAALQSVPDFIETGIPGEIHDDTHGRGYDVMRLYNAININGEVYRVKSTIKRLNIGDSYYTYEMQEMEFIGGTQSPAVGLDGTDNSRPQTHNSISGANLLKRVKKTNSDELILPESEGMMRDEEARPTSFPTEHSRSTAGKKSAAEETAKAVGVEFDYISRDELPEGHKGAKGMWRDGKIYICAENHANADDVKRTILHEAVGHMGLRRLVGNKNMSDFCMQVYKMLPASERAKIAAAAAQKYGLNFEEATEEYLAEMAETFDSSKDYDTVWDRIRVTLRNVLAKIGINVPLSERDVRWILWQSYNANRQGDLVNQAKRQVLADRLGFSFRADNMRQRASEGIRFRDTNNNAVTSAADLYNMIVSRASTRLHEGYVDMFNSVKTLVDAIEKQTGRAAAAFEDIRLALNQQSSKALAAIEHWERTYYNPLMETIKGIIKDSGLSSEEVDRYAFLKHGLERNVVLAKRDAKQYYEEKLRRKIAAIRMSNNSQADKDAKIQKAKDEYDRHCQDVDAGTDPKYLKLRDNDYSGLTSLYSTFTPVSPRGKNESNEQYQARVLASRTPMYDNLKDVEDAARKEVADLENKIGSAGVAELWKRTNAATKATLKHQYDSGMLTKEQYEHVRDMFQYYVPMRGFADNTAEDMYAYYASNRGGFTPPIQTAKGRKSQAASPWGYIGAMASSAVAADSKNEAKLTLYYFASNRPENDLITISDVWYEKTGVDPTTGKTIFTPVYPTFSESLDKASAKAALDQWEKDMQDKASRGEAFKGTRKLDLKNSVIHIDKENSNAHVIRVKVNGQDKMMFINGNPRAAQAINNELNLDAVSGPITNGAQAFLRHMAAFNTSYNPEFWISNLQRDLLFSLMAVDVKEDAGYRNDFLRNLRRSVKVFKMLRANKNGKLGTSRIENTYREFVDNGGVTGFTVVKDNEEWEQTKREFLADKNKAVQGVANALGAIQDLGESIEQMTRFAAYLTSREHGKDIREAISDAKELTVNFNRKGSGKPISIAEARQLTDKNGKPLSKAQQCFYVLASSMSRVGRLCVMFFNAGVQGLNTMYQLWKKDHRKTAVWMAGYFALGVVNAVLHSLFDDDDDYLDMPEYERRNNALLGGNGYYFKWALPQECRVFYAMGDVLVNDMILGRNPQKKMRGVGDIVESVFDVMPVNPMNGWRGVMPEIARPLVEIAMNEDYKGEDVHRDSRWLSDEEKELTPKYKQAYNSTPKPYVYLSMVANWASGGDSLDSGFFNLYPEDIQHLVEGYSGGLGTFVNRLYGATVGAVDSGARSAAKGEGFAKGVMETTSVRTTPFLNRLLIVNGERRRNAHTSEVFNYYKAEAEHTKRLIQEAKKSGDEKAIDKIFSDDERLNVYTFYEAYKKLDEAYFKLMRLTDDDTERRQLMREQDEIRKEMIEEIAKENKK